MNSDLPSVDDKTVNNITLLVMKSYIYHVLIYLKDS